MSRFSKYVKEKVVKVLVTALVAGTVVGNGTITVQAASVLETSSLSNPYSFAIYANEYTNANHVEGNVAIGTLKAHVDVWEGCSFVGDFADSNASVKMNIKEAALVFPSYNSDGSRNELTPLTGQGYYFSIYDGDTLRREFITDNMLVAYEQRGNIKETIAAELVEMQKVSASYYERADAESDTELVLNLTAGEVEGNIEKIFRAADTGKKVLVNITDSGNVIIPQQNDNWTSQRHEYADWAANIIWNLGNASRVETYRIFGYVLAPDATVHNGNNVIGGVICNIFEQVGEVHMPDPWNPRSTTEPTPTPVVTEEPTPTPTPVVTEEPTPTPVVTEEPTPTPVVTEAPTPTPVEPTPTPVEPTPMPVEPTATPVEPTPTPVVTEEPTPTPVVTEEPTPTPVVTEEPTPTPVVTEAPTPTPTATPTATPSVTPTATPATPDTPDEPTTPDTPDEPTTPEGPTTPNTPTDPGTPDNETTDTPQVLGARRRRMVTIEDEAAPLADRAVLGASRRPQTGDDSDAWNMGFALSLTGLGAWFIIKRKQS